MSMATVWFLATAGVSVLAFGLGRRLGRGPRQRGWLVMALSVGMLSIWAWLQHHPMVAVEVLPIGLLCYCEGTAGLPLFTLVLGAAWSMARQPRQRWVVRAALALGGVYFLQGGLWMLEATPTQAFGRSNDARPVIQSQDYSCVPAACATALRSLGQPATEQEMAELTRTRPRTGATLLRAMEGLQRKLAGTAWEVVLLELRYEELTSLPGPVLTSLRLETTRAHMVVIERAAPHEVWILDPVAGRTTLARQEFEEVYSGQVLFFLKR